MKIFLYIIISAIFVYFVIKIFIDWVFDFIIRIRKIDFLIKNRINSIPNQNNSGEFKIYVPSSGSSLMDSMNKKVNYLQAIMLGVIFVLLISFTGFIIDANNHKEDIYLEFFKIVREQKNYIDEQNNRNNNLKQEIQILNDKIDKLSNK